VGLGAGLYYMYDVVLKSSRSLSRLLMSSCSISSHDHKFCDHNPLQKSLKYHNLL